MITDIDNIPMNRTFFTKNIENIPNNKWINLRDWKPENQISMCWQVAKPDTWKQVFHIQNIEDIKNTLKSVANNINYIDGEKTYSSGWYTDQLFLYKYVMEWHKKTNNYIFLKDCNTGFNRLNPGDFKEVNNDLKNNIIKETYSDYHALKPMEKFSDINWQIYNLLNMEKISIIIPTYNRFNYLLNTIKSIKKQTYSNIEIIVVNDKSTQKDYYNYDWENNNIKIIHLDENSKDKFGHACAGGFQRNYGIKIATGKYIAFCDDDDIWFPKKLELQINAMKKSGCKMSSTDGLIGNGPYNINKNALYKKYNAEHYYKILQNIYKRKNSNLLENGFPKIWTLDFLKIHNCVICSSVILDKEIINQVGMFDIRGSRDEDYDYWLRALKYTNSVYVNDVCFYYDNKHGDGQNY